MSRRRISSGVLVLAMVAVVFSAQPASAAVVDGNDGNNGVFGTPGNDTLNGKLGTDYLFGGPGKDVLNGGDGTINYLFGGTGIDRSMGGSGVDIIVDDDGTKYDVISADAGNDQINAADGAKGKVDCGPGEDIAYLDPSDTYKNCEVVFMGSFTNTYIGTNRNDAAPAGLNQYALKKGNDTVTTSSVVFVLPGAGNDNVNASASTQLTLYDDDRAADTITGSPSNDNIYSADGASDTIDCGASGSDTVWQFTGENTLVNCEVVREGAGQSIDI